MIGEKVRNLREKLSRHGSLLVAFSGGVDSGVLLKVAYDVLGTRAAGCTAITPSLPGEERESAARTAREIGAPYFTVEYDELAIPGYRENDGTRCYLCKKSLFDHLKSVALEKGFETIAYGANHDDLSDFRPGMKAAEEMSIAAPLLEARLTKEEIRILGKELGLSIWDKPAAACLSSRIPAGRTITYSDLKAVECAESFLRKLGFRQIRVRHHGSIARIETVPDEMPAFLEPRRRLEISGEFRKLGFQYVTLDLEGYRQGGLSLPVRSGKENADS